MRSAIVYYADDPYRRVFRIVHESFDGEFADSARLDSVRFQHTHHGNEDVSREIVFELLPEGSPVPPFSGTPWTKRDDPYPPKPIISWYSTPPNIIEAALDLAGVTSRDTVLDLGSGQGAILVAAANRGARAIGIEWEPEAIAMSQAATAGMLVTIIEGDFNIVALPAASVVTMNLGGETPRLTYRPRTKIVAINSDPGLGEPSNLIEVDGHRIGLWVA